MKLLEENLEKNLHKIGSGNYFLDITLKVKLGKAKIDKDYMKHKNVCA